MPPIDHPPPSNSEPLSLQALARWVRFLRRTWLEERKAHRAYHTELQQTIQQLTKEVANHDEILLGNSTTRYTGLMDKVDRLSMSISDVEERLREHIHKSGEEQSLQRRKMQQAIEQEMHEMAALWGSTLAELTSEVTQLRSELSVLSQQERDRQKTLRGVAIGLGITSVTGVGTALTVLSQVLSGGAP